MRRLTASWDMILGEASGIRLEFGSNGLMRTGSSSMDGLRRLERRAGVGLVGSIIGTAPGVLALVLRWCDRGALRTTLGSVGLVEVVTCGAGTL